MSFDAEEVCRTHTVCPLPIVPAVDMKDPVQPIEYSPPALTLTGASALMPLMVTVFETRSDDSGTLPWEAKTNAIGVVSQASVVTLNG